MKWRKANNWCSVESRGGKPAWQGARKPLVSAQLTMRLLRMAAYNLQSGSPTATYQLFISDFHLPDRSPNVSLFSLEISDNIQPLMNNLTTIASFPAYPSTTGKFHIRPNRIPSAEAHQSVRPLHSFRILVCFRHKIMVADETEDVTSMHQITITTTHFSSLIGCAASFALRLCDNS